MTPFAAWQIELETLLDGERAGLEQALAEHDTVLAAVRANTVTKVAIAQGFALLGRQQPAGPLQARRKGYEQALDADTVTLSRITNQIAGHRRQIADLEQALEQLHQIAPQTDADTSEAA